MVVDVTRSSEWITAAQASQRVVSSRVEAVSLTGAVLGDVPVDAVSVSYDGEQAEAWHAELTLSDPSMVPTSTSSILDGRSGVMLRPWWRLLTTTGWMEVPCGTYIVEDPKVRDSGALSITVPGLDPLAVARRGKYGAAVVQVGGMTVTAALKKLFSVVAPGLPVSIGASTETLPASYELWERDPAEDWTEIAAMAGMVVRTDRMGVITAAAPATPAAAVASWVEGRDCPVTDLTSQLKTSTIPRRVVVVSTAPEVVPPVVGEWVNPDADSMLIVTEQRIESSTVTTKDGASSLARLSGERWARPQQTISLEVPARPDLSYRDVVALSRQRAGVSGLYQVGGWTLSLTGPDKPPALMSVQMMTRQ